MLRLPRNVKERRRMAHWSLAAVLFLAGIGAVGLYRFPPAAYGFYPLCPIHEYLHLECPGCGATRALAALLHGHFREAMRLNALAVGLELPMTVGYGVFSYVHALRGRAFCWPQVSTPAMYAGVGVVVVFAILRNL